eukprot:10495059-Alexandrium_andersonii.AAC.1
MDAPREAAASVGVTAVLRCHDLRVAESSVAFARAHASVLGPPHGRAYRSLEQLGPRSERELLCRASGPLQTQ